MSSRQILRLQTSAELSQFENFISLRILLIFLKAVWNMIWFTVAATRSDVIYTISFNKTTKVKMSSNVMLGNSFKRTSWSCVTWDGSVTLRNSEGILKNEHQNHLYFRVVCLLFADIRLLSSSSLFASWVATFFFGLNFLFFFEISASSKGKTSPFIQATKKIWFFPFRSCSTTFVVITSYLICFADIAELACYHLWDITCDSRRIRLNEKRTFVDFSVTPNPACIASGCSPLMKQMSKERRWALWFESLGGAELN